MMFKRAPTPIRCRLSKEARSAPFFVVRSSLLKNVGWMIPSRRGYFWEVLWDGDREPHDLHPDFLTAIPPEMPT